MLHFSLHSYDLFLTFYCYLFLHLLNNKRFDLYILSGQKRFIQTSNHILSH